MITQNQFLLASLHRLGLACVYFGMDKNSHLMGECIECGADFEGEMGWDADGWECVVWPDACSECGREHGLHEGIGDPDVREDFHADG